ncbi:MULTISPECIES: phosphonate metabolism protein PhnP [Vitreoscilla]|uniref:Phosphonate metabolism protein PhnP n=1 Tax=Vitreoscilla stercoraria TaxID=61 RepID=A0ABY4E8A8_VITST|nr:MULTISPECIES: phosphonate metabolism protein PhnP [Vitreoscilla]AUZ04828.1 phosphonate metabolism protein PhnP [Vitreoscilla sp. C1]UOO91504.1 phosphonate metabolism protein PhnP [Vitreoscilla stercoraria]
MMSLTLLGTGDAAQIPVYGCECFICMRAQAIKIYRRLPCSALLEVNGHKLLIDSGLTDLAERFPKGTLKHILQTHYHADHVQGLLHLRWGVGESIQVLGPHDDEGFADLLKHSGILDFSKRLAHGDAWQWQNVIVTALAMNHSKPTLGYLFDNGNSKVAYLTDTVGLPDETLAYLSGVHLDALVIDCAYPPQAKTPRNHNDFNMVQYLATVLSCKEMILTHIGHAMDEWVAHLQEPLPPKFVLAHDGMQRHFA